MANTQTQTTQKKSVGKSNVMNDRQNKKMAAEEDENLSTDQPVEGGQAIGQDDEDVDDISTNSTRKNRKQ